MAEKLFEDLLSKGFPDKIDPNRWLLEKFKNSSASCSVEEFAEFYMNLVKSQTDEFIRNNTSTCNTPRKMTLTNAPESISDSVKKLALNNREGSSEPQTAGQKRQSSRELFSKDNRNCSAGRVIDSPNIETQVFYNRKSGGQTSTPVSSFSRINQSIEGTPTNTSTPTSFRHTGKNSSMSLNDQSSMTFRNSSRNSLDLSSKNNSMNRRNTSSPMCLADFINSSSNSGKGKKKNSSQKSPLLETSTPKLSSSDFPSLGDSSLNDSKSQPKSKPKKRVVPITISRNTTPGKTNFISSSFQSDNNLLNSAFDTEEVDILSERKMMRDERDALSKNLPVEMESKPNLHAIVKENLASIAQSPRKVATFEFDESKVERQDALKVMAKIYSFLLDINLVSNVLTELSYLFNLLNTEYEPLDQLQSQSQNKSIADTAASLLKSLNNCVFFTVQVLICQKRNLALLDTMTIRVLIDNDRIQLLAVELADHLRLILQQKSQLEAAAASKLTKTSGSSIGSVVFYQQETDNRDNFPSDREFGAFKKQRDMFYAILRSWEMKHLDSTYDFRKDLGLRIRSLITLMEHPINMAHLAKLFTAQLIISCNFDNSANELQMVLPNIDLGKLSKLRQRLVAPSQFSTQYLFPGNQAFFRDFIICADQFMIFMEQLKIALINELMQINDSSMEALSITQGNEDEKTEASFREEFIVRPETLTTMRVLAKFTGFVVSRPYTFDGYRNPLVDQKQSQIRNMLHPNFDVTVVVRRAIDGRKLLVTIPWLVEYLTMLDYITIRLDYYRDLFQLLYSVYSKVNIVSGAGSLCYMPTSKFIIRACLGWLFEHPEIPEEYCTFNNLKVDLKAIDDGVEQKSPDHLNPHLETILTAACPFLADFRVSMMPQRMTKVVSRTGRYRHITTKFQDKANVQKTKVQDSRERLVEAFLASQTLSVRKIVDFAIDRVTSAVVKDFQVKFLLTIRKQAKIDVEQLAPTVRDVEVLAKKMAEVYQAHLKQLQQQWDSEVKENTVMRIQGAFDSLLPIETLPDVKKTLVNITLDKTNEKLDEWNSANINTIEIFSKDIKIDALKLKENQQQNGNRRTTSNIVIDLSSPTMPSDFCRELQTLLHIANLKPGNLQYIEIMKSINMACEVLEKQVLPTNAYRNIAFYMLQLLLLCIANRVDLVTKDLLTKLLAMWKHEKLREFTTKNSQGEDASQLRRKVDDFIFENVISSRIILMMHGRSKQHFEVYGNFLIQLVKEKFITADQINEQSVRLYKQEWTTECLNAIAFLIQHVKDSLQSSTTSSDSQLFMELVVDLAKDMENF